MARLCDISSILTDTTGPYIVICCSLRRMGPTTARPCDPLTFQSVGHNSTSAPSVNNSRWAAKDLLHLPQASTGQFASPLGFKKPEVPSPPIHQFARA